MTWVIKMALSAKPITVKPASIVMEPVIPKRSSDLTAATAQSMAQSSVMGVSGVQMSVYYKDQCVSTSRLKTPPLGKAFLLTQVLNLETQSSLLVKQILRAVPFTIASEFKLVVTLHSSLALTPQKTKFRINSFRLEHFRSAVLHALTFREVAVSAIGNASL